MTSLRRRSSIARRADQKAVGVLLVRTALRSVAGAEAEIHRRYSEPGGCYSG